MQKKLFSVNYFCKKKLHLRCSNRFLIPTSLKLTIKTPEQYQSNHSYAFIVDFEGRFSKIKINRWLNIVLKFWVGKVSILKKCFASNNNDSRINEILYSKVRSGRIINGKEGFLDLRCTVV